MTEINQTGVQIRWTLKPSVLIPKDTEPRFSSIIVPTWLYKFASGDNSWRSLDDEDHANSRTLCNIILGDDFNIDISEHSAAWKKVRLVLFQ